MKKNTLIVLVLALLAMASTTAFGQACQGSWSFTQNSVTNTWSLGSFTSTAPNSGCYLAKPTIDPTWTGGSPTLGNGITTNNYSYVYSFALVNGVYTPITGNPSFYPYTVVNGVLYQYPYTTVVNTPGVGNGYTGNVVWYPGQTYTPANGVTINGVGYGIPVNGILGPNYGTGYSTVAGTWYGVVGNTLVQVANGQVANSFYVPATGGTYSLVNGPIVNGVSTGYMVVGGTVANAITTVTVPPTNGYTFISNGPLGTGYTSVWVLNGVQVPANTVNATKITVPTGGPAWSGQAYDRSNGAAMDVLGGHGASAGCMMCHTPHNSGRMDTTSPVRYNSTLGNVYDVPGGNVIGNYFTNAAAGPFSPYAPTNTTAFIWKTNSIGTQLGGSMNPYLWNKGITTVTYTTWDGVGSPVTANGGSVPTISAGLLSTGKEPVVHTLLCMSCHDNSMSSHGMTNQTLTSTKVGNTTYVTGYSNGSIAEPGAVTGTITNGVVAWGQGSLAANHPVHAVYPADGGQSSPNGPYYWMVTPNANGTVTFVDNDTNQLGDSGFYGHPARLYSDGTTAWVECTSCHNPHRMTSPAYLNKSGTYTVGAYGTTTYYLRGPYSTLDGTISAGFCRSCHYDKSPEYIANGGAPR